MTKSSAARDSRAETNNTHMACPNSFELRTLRRLLSFELDQRQSRKDWLVVEWRLLRRCNSFFIEYMCMCVCVCGGCVQIHVCVKWLGFKFMRASHVRSGCEMVGGDVVVVIYFIRSTTTSDTIRYSVDVHDERRRGKHIKDTKHIWFRYI